MNTRDGSPPNPTGDLLCVLVVVILAMLLAWVGANADDRTVYPHARPRIGGYVQ